MPAGKGSMAPTERPHTRENVPVAFMSDPEKGMLAITKAKDRLPADAKKAWDAFLSPASLTVMGAGLAVWAGSHYFGIGEVLDLIFFLGLLASGATAWSVAAEVWTAGTILKTATTEAQIDDAAAHLSNAMVLIAPDLLLALFSGVAAMSAKSVRAVAAMATKAGMLEEHFNALKQVAAEMNRIIIVRNTNPKCLQWIRAGFPAKPRWIESIKTSKITGIATARLEVAADLKDILLARMQGHFAVDADGVARGLKGEVLTFETPPSWPLEPGQIIDRVTRKPYVGDYDMLDVIDPANLTSHGVLESQYYGMGIQNITNADYMEVMRRMNQRIGPRLMHAGWAVYDDVVKAGDVTAVFPDGTVEAYTAAEIKDLYLQWGRPIITKPVSTGL